MFKLELPFAAEDGGDVGILDFFPVVADGKREEFVLEGDLQEIEEGLGGGMGRGGLPEFFGTRFVDGSVVFILDLGEFGDAFVVLLPLGVATSRDTLLLLTVLLSALPISVSLYIEFLGLLFGVPCVEPLGLATGLPLRLDPFFFGLSGTPFIALLVTMTSVCGDDVGTGRLLFGLLADFCWRRCSDGSKSVVGRFNSLEEIDKKRENVGEL